jgi:hypothetical protein
VACVAISLTMNAMAAGRGWRDVAIWVMPAAVYGLASDTLIGVSLRLVILKSVFALVRPHEYGQARVRQVSGAAWRDVIGG